MFVAPYWAKRPFISAALVRSNGLGVGDWVGEEVGLSVGALVGSGVVGGVGQSALLPVLQFGDAETSSQQLFSESLKIQSRVFT